MKERHSYQEQLPFGLAFLSVFTSGYFFTEATVGRDMVVCGWYGRGLNPQVFSSV